MARIEFEGNLGSAPEMRFTKAGTPVLGFRVADSKSKKNDQGGWDEIANQWLSVSVWGSLGELLLEKLDKGTRVRVIGEFYVREYDGNNGPGFSLDVKAWGVDILSKPKQESGRNSSGGFGGTPTNGSWTPDAGAAPGGWGAPSGGAAGGWGTGAPAGDEPPF